MKQIAFALALLFSSSLAKKDKGFRVNMTYQDPIDSMPLDLEIGNEAMLRLISNKRSKNMDCDGWDFAADNE